MHRKELSGLWWKAGYVNWEVDRPLFGPVKLLRWSRGAVGLASVDLVGVKTLVLCGEKNERRMNKTRRKPPYACS